MTDALTSRYASPEMTEIFDDRNRYETWRKLWLFLARAEKEAGLDIPDRAIEEMSSHLQDIDFARVKEIESETRHDVMAHLRHFGELCPTAKPFMHLGATSCFITDNADLLLMREALHLVRRRLASVLVSMEAFIKDTARIPAMGFTHFKPAQPTTVGKRACLWMQDLLDDYARITTQLQSFPFRGVKGTTGTQASFLELLGGGPEKVKTLQASLLAQMESDREFPVTGQTYPRKFDWQVASLLEGIAVSSGKMSKDLRLLNHLQELTEPRGKAQVGSSAMPYKQNPMKAERVTSLSRYLVHLARNTADTAMDQWLERTLDDSANRRLVIPQMFMTADGLLILLRDIMDGITVHREMIDRRLSEELPFLIVESIMMEGVKRGGDRQELHESLRRHALSARENLNTGGPNPFLQLVADDGSIPFDLPELSAMADPDKLTGLAPEQALEFLTYHSETLKDASEHAAEKTDLQV